MMRRRPLLQMVALVFAAAVLAAAGAGVMAMRGGQGRTAPASSGVPTLVPRIVETYPHDRRAFTQGLVLRDGVLYESTGLVGQSSLRIVNPRTGQVTRQVQVAAPYFAEGLADVGPRLLQLTWQHGVAFVYDRQTLARTGEFTYSGEGWGLCHSGRALYMSDGSATLTERDPQTFAVRRTLRVVQDGAPVDRLNELECVGTDVYANVWTTDTIVRIETSTGRVTARIDAAGLLGPMDRVGVDVLNGIAHDPADGTFLITGKLWPRLFRVRFEPRR
jgi:glutaminyl-peptide cyclotransferase